MLDGTPVTPVCTTSRTPPTSYATVGTPTAPASSTAPGMPSMWLGQEQQVGAGSSSATSGRAPSRCTRPSSPASAIWDSICAVRGPAPSTISRASAACGARRPRRQQPRVFFSGVGYPRGTRETRHARRVRAPRAGTWPRAGRPWVARVPSRMAMTRCSGRSHDASASRRLASLTETTRSHRRSKAHAKRCGGGPKPVADHADVR